MIWYLIFCSDVHGGAVCNPPMPMRDKAACIFMGKQMKGTHAELRGERGNSFKCVGVRKAGAA